MFLPYQITTLITLLRVFHQLLSNRGIGMAALTGNVDLRSTKQALTAVISRLYRLSVTVFLAHRIQVVRLSLQRALQKANVFGPMNFSEKLLSALLRPRILR